MANMRQTHGMPTASYIFSAYIARPWCICGERCHRRPMANPRKARRPITGSLRTHSTYVGHTWHARSACAAHILHIRAWFAHGTPLVHARDVKSRVCRSADFRNGHTMPMSFPRRSRNKPTPYPTAYP